MMNVKIKGLHFMIEIKQLPPERWQDYQKLRLEALKADPIAFGSSYEEEISRPEEFWRNRIGNMFFAVENNRPVGMVRYAFETRVKNKHVAGIYAMYVDKEFRNQGIGKRLMEGVISLIAENKDIHKIRLSVTPEQIYAVKLYEHYGFKSVGLFINELCVDGRYYGEVPMEKFI
jgi:ribosomal protein S18 acetylase RimI-like enzyme